MQTFIGSPARAFESTREKIVADRDEPREQAALCAHVPSGGAELARFRPSAFSINGLLSDRNFFGGLGPARGLPASSVLDVNLHLKNYTHSPYRSARTSQTTLPPE